MEWDILINTKSGDSPLTDTLKNVIYYDVVWGAIFDDDADGVLYANIVVPFKSIKGIKYSSDGVYVCNVSAPYIPNEAPFVARFVTKVADTYQLASLYSATLPKDAQCYYVDRLSSKEIMASALPMLNIDGFYRFVFRDYDGYCTANVFSAYESDFNYGQSDDQAAQLLALCAPGKYYKHPTTGVDITKYINSVVSHTDMASNLFNQFQRDDKGVYEADFDSTTGILGVNFNGIEAVDEDAQELLPVDQLDFDIFKISTDDYIRSILRLSNVFDKKSFISSLTDYSNIIMIRNVGDAKGELINDEKIAYKHLEFDNILADDEGMVVVSCELPANTIIRFAFNVQNCITDWSQLPVFNLVDADGNIVYETPESFIPNDDDCALVLKPLTLNYSIDLEDLEAGFGVYRITNEDELKDIVVVADDGVGGMYAVVTNESNINNVRYEHTTGNIIAFKNLEE